MQALRPLLDYLAPLGVLPVPPEVRLDAVEELLVAIATTCSASVV